MLTPRHLSNAIDADRYEMYVILTAVLSTFRFDFFHGKVLGAAVKEVATSTLWKIVNPTDEYV